MLFNTNQLCVLRDAEEPKQSKPGKFALFPKEVNFFANRIFWRYPRKVKLALEIAVSHIFIAKFSQNHYDLRVSRPPLPPP